MWHCTRLKHVNDNSTIIFVEPVPGLFLTKSDPIWLGMASSWYAASWNDASKQ